MSQLRPCPDCQRHVRVSETACPFCSAAIEPIEPAAPPRRSSASVTRAALFAGATLLGGAACADKPEAQEPEKVERQQTDAAPLDPIDDGVDQEGNVEVDEEAERKRAEEEERRRQEENLKRERDVVRDRDIAKPYGAPPSREKIV